MASFTQADLKEHGYLTARVADYANSFDKYLRVRILNVLHMDEAVYFAEAIIQTRMELLRTPDFGKKSIDDLIRVLDGFGLELGSRFEGFERMSYKFDDIRKNFRIALEEAERERNEAGIKVGEPFTRPAPVEQPLMPARPASRNNMPTPRDLLNERMKARSLRGILTPR